MPRAAVRTLQRPAALLLASAGCACAALAVPLSVTVTTPSGAPVEDAVVSVNVRGTPTAAAPGKVADMGQRKKRFEPAVLAVQAGTAVNFPNFDTVRHHVYSFSRIKTFDIKLYAATPAAPVVFEQPGTAVLGCNIHDAMTAHIRVVDTPYFALTDAHGKARLDVPAGSHVMKVWHPAMAPEQEPTPQPLVVGSGSTEKIVKVEAN